MPIPWYTLFSFEERVPLIVSVPKDETLIDLVYECPPILLQVKAMDMMVKPPIAWCVHAKLSVWPLLMSLCLYSPHVKNEKYI